MEPITLSFDFNSIYEFIKENPNLSYIAIYITGFLIAFCGGCIYTKRYEKYRDTLIDILSGCACGFGWPIVFCFIFLYGLYFLCTFAVKNIHEEGNKSTDLLK